MVALAANWAWMWVTPAQRRAIHCAFLECRFGGVLDWNTQLVDVILVHGIRRVKKGKDGQRHLGLLVCQEFVQNEGL